MVFSSLDSFCVHVYIPFFVSLFHFCLLPILLPDHVHTYTPPSLLPAHFFLPPPSSFLIPLFFFPPLSSLPPISSTGQEGTLLFCEDAPILSLTPDPCDHRESLWVATPETHINKWVSSIVLYCTVHGIALYCTSLYCIVLCCTVHTLRWRRQMKVCVPYNRLHTFSYEQTTNVSRITLAAHAADTYMV